MRQAGFFCDDVVARALRCCALCVFLTCTAHSQTIINLGVLPGGTNSHGQAVDYGGQTVVGYGDTPASGAKAFIWYLGGGIHDLGAVGPGRYSYGFAVSDDGLVAGGRTESHGFRDRGFRWTQGGGMVDLGTLPGGFSSIAYSMSADGLKLAGWSDFDCCSGPRPVRWNIGGGIDNCGVLSASFPQYAQAWAISADGMTVVGYSNSNAQPNYRAVRWTQAGGLLDLGDLGGGYAQARAVSGDGSVITGESNTTTASHAFRWRDGIMDDLGSLPGTIHSYAGAVTRDGLVILGYSYNPGWDNFMWTETFGMESFTQYLQNEGLNLTGWVLDEINGISGDGRCIVGTGRFNGLIRGYLIRLPHPICGPRITAHPQSVIGCVDGTVTMFCDAFNISGLHLPQFQWQKRGNDGEWNDLPNFTSPFGTTFSGTNTPMITISSCSSDAPGLYRCMVTGGCASRPSAAATVSLINVAPVFSVQIPSQYACPNDTVVFSAGPFSAGGQPYSFQWERETFADSNVFVSLNDGSTLGWDGNVPGRGAVVSGAITGLLTIAPDAANGRTLGPGLNRRFRCAVTNACGVAISNHAGLKVWQSCVQADVNCDNEVSVSDIGNFVLLLTNRPEYEVQFPDCNPDNGDLNEDGLVGVSDIGLFVAILIG